MAKFLQLLLVLPVSTTHSIVGGVMGAGIAAAGFGNLFWDSWKNCCFLDSFSLVEYCSCIFIFIKTNCLSR